MCVKGGAGGRAGGSRRPWAGRVCVAGKAKQARGVRGDKAGRAEARACARKGKAGEGVRVPVR